jgi:hypothetical protein
LLFDARPTVASSGGSEKKMCAIIEMEEKPSGKKSPPVRRKIRRRLKRIKAKISLIKLLGRLSDFTKMCVALLIERLKKMKLIRISLDARAALVISIPMMFQSGEHFNRRARADEGA